MAWVRIHDGAFDSPKVACLSDKAFRLWVWGLSYAQMHLTDGLLPTYAIPRRLMVVVNELTMTVAMIGRSPLWERHDAGFKIHNYLKWNDSREAILAGRILRQHRGLFLRDPNLRHCLRARDGDFCRYCGRAVNWHDRKGDNGATYDQVDPRGIATLENLVIACRACHSKKDGRQAEEAQMVLLGPRGSRSKPDGSRLDLDPHQRRIKDSTSGVVWDRSSSEKESEEKPDASDRAGRLLQELYPAWYAQYRHGARLRLVANTLAFQDAISVCETWPDERIEKLARIFLTTDDDWISKTDRSFRLFASKASWCDDRLRAWENEQEIA